MQKKALIIVIILVLLLGTVGFFYYKYNSVDINSTVALADYVKDTTLEVTKGTEVSVKEKDGAEYQKIAGTVVLQEGNYIKVGTDSEALINWSDDSVTRLSAGTELHVTQLQVDQNDPTNTGISFDLFNGEVWSKAMNIVNDKSTFSMRSGQNTNVVAGIRGTTVGFSVDAKYSRLRAVKHAIYLVGLDVDVTEGEQADIQNNPVGNGNANSANSNTNGPIVKGNLLIDVNKIPDDAYQSPWFVQNLQADDQHEQTIRNRLLDKLEGQLRGTDDPIRNFKLQQAIDGATDLKAKVRLLLQFSTEKLQRAVILLARGENNGGKNLWNEYQQLIQRIGGLLAQIDDAAFVLDIQQKIVANANLWVKYSYLLLPDDTDLSNDMEDIVLGLTPDETRKGKLKDLFDAREFFQMSDDLHEGEDPSRIQDMLARYKVLINKLQSGQLQQFECKILLGLRDKLKKYVLDLPPVFDCRTGGNSDGPDSPPAGVMNVNGSWFMNDNGNLSPWTPENNNANSDMLDQNANENTNRPVTNQNRNSRLNTNVNAPDKAVLDKLLARLGALSCDNLGIAITLKAIVADSSKLTAAHMVTFKAKLAALTNRCLTALQPKLDELKKELEAAMARLRALSPIQFTFPVNGSTQGTILKNLVNSLQAKVNQLQAVLNGLAGF